MTKSIVLRAASRWTAVIDRLAAVPRWVDAPWAVLSVAGMVLSWIFESGPPFWWFGVSNLAFLLRLEVTSRRLVLRTSALIPLAQSIADRLYERRQRRLEARRRK